MISEKELFLYFTIKTIRSLPREWRHRLSGVTVDVKDSSLKYGKQGKRIMGYWHRGNKHIVFYAPLNLLAGYTDPYEAIKGIEGLVKHELYHAVGVTREEWNKWATKK